MKVNITNIDLSGLFFSHKRGGLIYPKIETIDVNNYHMPFSKSVLLLFENKNKKFNDFISLNEVIGAIIPEGVGYIDEMLIKNGIPFIRYNPSGDGRQQKLDAIKRLAKIHAEIIVD